MPYPSCHTSSPDTFPGGRRSWRTGNRVPEPGHSAEPSNHHCERWSRRRAGHFGSGHSTDHWPATDENWGWHRQTDKSREYDLSCCGSGYQRQIDITCTQITKYYGYNRCSRFHSLLAGLLPPYTWLLSLVLYSTYWQIEKKKKTSDRSFTTYPPSKAQQQKTWPCPTHPAVNTLVANQGVSTV